MRENTLTLRSSRSSCWSYINNRISNIRKLHVVLSVVCVLSLVAFYWTIQNALEARSFLIDEAAIATLSSVPYRLIRIPASLSSLPRDVNDNVTLVTVVSVYFALRTSKHSEGKYRRWMINMLRSVNQTPLLIYTDERSAEHIRRVRAAVGSTTTATTLVVYSSIWHVMRELELTRNRSSNNYIGQYRHGMTDLDVERRRHNPELYALWNLKTFVTHKAAQLLKTDNNRSSFFIYTDLGAWREHVLPGWPDVTVIARVRAHLADRVLFGQLAPFDVRTYAPTDVIIIGTFFAGSERALRRLSAEYYALHDALLDAGLFVGKDQTLMNMLAFERQPGLIVRLRIDRSGCTRFCCDPWFFYQRYFANAADYFCSDHIAMLDDDSSQLISVAPAMTSFPT